MILKILNASFSVCKIDNISEVNFEDDFVFFSKTDEELSLVCREESVPNNYILVEHGWKGIRIEGELEFSLVGILSKIANILAEHKISIFAISTYNTDYILVKAIQLELAVTALQSSGYEILDITS